MSALRTGLIIPLCRRVRRAGKNAESKIKSKKRGNKKKSEKEARRI